MRNQNTLEEVAEIQSLLTDIKKEYTNGEVTIVWQSGKCTHSANCVKNNPAVFKPKEQPWITPDNSTTEKMVFTKVKELTAKFPIYHNK